jgi:hypothetical protein
MSYDLAVFDPVVAPQERAEFLEWYEAQTEWNEGHSYSDPAVSTPALRGWFFEIIREFPQMNGPYASQPPRDDDSQTDYSVGKYLIYAAFSWSKVDAAYEATFRLAGKHRVGFFDVSSEKSSVWLPNAAGQLVLRHSD